MAGFEVIIYGRFWVIAEDPIDYEFFLFSVLFKERYGITHV